MELTQILGLALLCRSLTQIFKKIYNKEQKIFHIPELVSIGIGVVVSSLTDYNMFSSIIPGTTQFIHWLFVVITGVVLGQGGSFVYDLWSALQSVGISVKAVPEDVLNVIQALKNLASTNSSDNKNTTSDTVVKNIKEKTE